MRYRLLLKEPIIIGFNWLFPAPCSVRFVPTRGIKCFSDLSADVTFRSCERFTPWPGVGQVESYVKVEPGGETGV